MKHLKLFEEFNTTTIINITYILPRAEGEDIEIDFDSDTPFYRGLQNEPTQMGSNRPNFFRRKLETWTKHYNIANRYAKLNSSSGKILTAELDIKNPLVFNWPGSEISLGCLVKMWSEEEIREILKDVEIRAYYPDNGDGIEVNGVPNNIDLQMCNVVIFDLIDKDEFVDLLKKINCDSVIYLGWEGDTLEYRVLSDDQINILDIENK